jgi:hypothetical protein
MSYPKDMYVKVCGTREWASIRVLGYMYIIYIREYITIRWKCPSISSLCIEKVASVAEWLRTPDL